MDRTRKVLEIEQTSFLDVRREIFDIVDILGNMKVMEQNFETITD